MSAMRFDRHDREKDGQDGGQDTDFLASRIVVGFRLVMNLQLGHTRSLSDSRYHALGQQLAFFEMAHLAREMRGMRIVRDHHDGFAELLI